MLRLEMLGPSRFPFFYLKTITCFFCDADEVQLDFLGQVLTWVQMVLGLNINLKKCDIFPVGEVDKIELLAWVLHCKVGALPSAYLGLPLETQIRILVCEIQYFKGLRSDLQVGKRGVCLKV